MTKEETEINIGIIRQYLYGRLQDEEPGTFSILNTIKNI
jgi:hypothetical protein